LGGQVWSRLLQAQQQPSVKAVNAEEAASTAAVSAPNARAQDDTHLPPSSNGVVEGTAAFLLAEPHFCHVR
jgi:hypothetical protein